ncbi:MAG: DUF2867 domain-containing protein [Cytophagaceae bacterium]
MKLEQSHLPVNSLIEKSFSKIDYSDAFMCRFTSEKKIIVDDLVKAFAYSAPAWVEKLFSMRNRIVKLIGLKVPDEKKKEQDKENFTVEVGNSLGLFKILDKNLNEVIMGEDDKHLNFRISLFLENDYNNYSFTLSTTVQHNNWLGKLYFIPVRPFHKFIVPSMMKGIIKNINK